MKPPQDYGKDLQIRIQLPPFYENLMNQFLKLLMLRNVWGNLVKLNLFKWDYQFFFAAAWFFNDAFKKVYGAERLHAKVSALKLPKIIT